VSAGIVPQALASLATVAVLVLCFVLSQRRDRTSVSTADEDLVRQSVSAVTAATQERPLTAAPPNVPDPGVAAVAAAPFDTAITHTLTRDALVFRLPPNRSGLAAVAFLVSWLVGWTIPIFIALLGIVYVVMGALKLTDETAPMNLGTGWPAGIFIVFIAGWLIGAAAGETAAMRMLFARLVMTTGMQYVIATPGALLHVARVGGLQKTSAYDAAHIANLRAGDSIRTFSGTDEGMQFDYGKRKIAITGMTKAEAGWMTAAIDGYRTARASG
jgi:hypothetical protein